MAMKLVDADVLEADLTSVADSIRAKTGGEEKLAFPSGFESALDTIESADSALAEVEYMMSAGYTNYGGMMSNIPQMMEIPTSILRYTENGTNFSSMFYNLVNIVTIPAVNTVNGKTFDNMFYGDSHLTNIEGIDLTSATSVRNMLYGCSKLENIVFNGVIKITGLDLSPCSKLTHDSLMSAINALFDHKTAGSSGTFKLTLGSTNLAKLTDAEKAIATQRGWTLA